MGKWNRRYLLHWKPRKNYPDPHWSPPRESYLDPEFGVWQDNVPLWEKKFCYLSGVAWEKILSIKKLIHCHKNVLDWDDLAGKEAFHQAKELYWVKVNGLPCEFQLPGPDLYIDKVDWNPNIDPELIQDLDREFFVPDEDDSKVGAEGTNPKPCLTSGGLQDTSRTNYNDNPWERDTGQTSGAMKDKATGWNLWDNSFANGARKPTNNDNPWEFHSKQDCPDMKYDSWGDMWSKMYESKQQNCLETVKVLNKNSDAWKHCDNRWADSRVSLWSNNRHISAGNNRTTYYNGSNSGYHHGFGKKGASKDRSSFWGHKRWNQYGSNVNRSLEGAGEKVGGSRKREGSSCRYRARSKGPKLQYFNQTYRG